MLMELKPDLKILSQREVSRHSVWTTIAHISIWCRKEFVYIIGSTAFHRNFHCIPAAATSFKAYRPSYFTIFHCRMATIEPARPICATSEFRNTLCWHFCSCGSHKTVPARREFVVIIDVNMVKACVVCVLSCSVTQIFVVETCIG